MDCLEAALQQYPHSTLTPVIAHEAR